MNELNTDDVRDPMIVGLAIELTRPEPDEDPLFTPDDPLFEEGRCPSWTPYVFPVAKALVTLQRRMDEMEARIEKDRAFVNKTFMELQEIGKKLSASNQDIGEEVTRQLDELKRQLTLDATSRNTLPELTALVRAITGQSRYEED
jgi:hypothetical protein